MMDGEAADDPPPSPRQEDSNHENIHDTNVCI